MFESLHLLRARWMRHDRRIRGPQTTSRESSHEFGRMGSASDASVARPCRGVVAPPLARGTGGAGKLSAKGYDDRLLPPRSLPMLKNRLAGLFLTTFPVVVLAAAFLGQGCKGTNSNVSQTGGG